MTTAIKQLLSRIRPTEVSTSAPHGDVIAPAEPNGSVPEVPVRPRHLLLFGRQMAVAIDEQAVQVAVTSRFGKRSKIIDVRKIYFPSAAIASSELRQAFVTRTVDEIIQELGRPSMVTITIDGPETAFRQLTLPALGRKQLAASVNFQARKILPFPISDCWFDHRVTWRYAIAESHKFRISLVGATRQLIDDRLQPFRALGLPVQSCVLAQDVIGQLLRQLPDFSPQANYALINIERTRSEISYFKGSNLEFSHILSVGSSFLANRTDPTMFEYFAESLASEIQNSLDYYSGQFASRFGSQLYIYGDLAYSDDLVELLDNRFELEFRRFPVEQLRFLKNHPVETETPLGVCLSVVAAAVNTAVLPDLLPTADKDSLRRRSWEKRIIGCIAACLVVIALVWVQRSILLANEHKRLAELHHQVADFKASDLYGSYQRIKLQVAASQSYLEQAKARPSYLGLLLKELTTITPPAVRFVQIGLQSADNGRNFHIYGSVRNDGVPPEVVLAEFVENLGGSDFFDEVTINHYAPRNVDGVNLLDFDLEMKAGI